MVYSDLPSYLIAVYVLIPVIVFVLLVILIYICCSKRFRLNWFERSLLDHQEECQRINCVSSHSPSSHTAPRLSCGSLRRTSLKYGPLIATPRTSMGSNPSHASTPGGTNDAQSSDSSENFWVPPDVVKKKRAQSLVAAMLHQESDEGKKRVSRLRSAPTPNHIIRERDRGKTPQGKKRVSRLRSAPTPNHIIRERDRGKTPQDVSSGPEGTPTSSTPIMSTSLQELSFNLPTEKLTESLQQAVQLPPTFNRQRRRASMHDAIDHTKINTRLYDRVQPARQQSIGSIQEENIGSINFSLDYNYETGLMTVRVIQARDLVPRDLSGTANPYCQVSILPSRRAIMQTKHVKKTLNPEFEEEFLFEVLPNNLATRTLQILIFDYDQFSRDEVLGQVHVSLDGIDFSERVVLWKGISVFEKNRECTELGDLMFSLGYLSSAKRLTVVIMKARNLKIIDRDKGTSDPYVKVSISYAGKKLKKKKTSTIRNTLNPIWNEALVFNIGNDYLNKLEVHINVIHDNLLGNTEYLGHIEVGPRSTGEELAHWNDMVHSKSAIARWHHLV
ncbi:synaptotagmin-5-like isoform X2 [Lineus longissimus]|uniref:synaptotagmin-5-like isoform X2 n=1 Tax=Lineus longissimus TaxID=88925 RepID=UPI00315DE15E